MALHYQQSANELIFIKFFISCFALIDYTTINNRTLKHYKPFYILDVSSFKAFKKTHLQDANRMTLKELR